MALETDAPGSRTRSAGWELQPDDRSRLHYPAADRRRPARCLLPVLLHHERPLARWLQWLIGNDVPGETANDFGGVSQYGTLFPQQFLVFGGGGTSHSVIDDFQNNLGTNPCPAFR